MAANWAELLPDLLSIIAKKVNSYEDFVAFGGVCRPWRSVAAIKDNFCANNQVPWLVLPEEEGGDGFCDFYSLSKGGMVHKVYLPEAKDKTFLSSLGWLITIDNDDGDMELLHPLSRDRIGLPGNFKTTAVKKAILSASPSQTKDYTLMIMPCWGGYLAYWKPGNTAWTTVDVDMSPWFEDVVYYQGQFYAISDLGKLFYIDVNGPNPATAKLFARAPMLVMHYQRNYLVESGGDLLAVLKKVARVRNDQDGTYKWMTRFFSVYRIPISGNEMVSDFELIDDLGVRSLFLGKDEVISIVASDTTTRQNCIYFTDDTHNLYDSDMIRVESDMGIYNLREKSIETFCGGQKGSSSDCLPFWVIPSF